MPTAEIVYKLKSGSNRKQQEVSFSGDDTYCIRQVGGWVFANQPIEVIAVRMISDARTDAGTVAA